MRLTLGPCEGSSRLKGPTSTPTRGIWNDKVSKPILESGQGRTMPGPSGGQAARRRGLGPVGQAHRHLKDHLNLEVRPYTMEVPPRMAVYYLSP